MDSRRGGQQEEWTAGGIDRRGCHSESRLRFAFTVAVFVDLIAHQGKKDLGLGRFDGMDLIQDVDGGSRPGRFTGSDGFELLLPRRNGFLVGFHLFLQILLFPFELHQPPREFEPHGFMARRKFTLIAQAVELIGGL